MCAHAQHWMSFSIALALFVKQSLTQPAGTDSASLADYQAPRSFSAPYPSTGITSAHFLKTWVIQTQVFMLVWQTLYQFSHLPSPPKSSFLNKTFFKDLFIHLLYISTLLCLQIHHKWASDLITDGLSHHVVAGNYTQDLWKSSQRS